MFFINDKVFKLLYQRMNDYFSAYSLVNDTIARVVTQV